MLGFAASSELALTALPRVTVFYPRSDVSVTGWAPSAGTSVAATLDDTSRTDYSTGPDLSTPVRMSWLGDDGGVVTVVSAGTWDIQVDAKYIGSSGQIRIELFDAGGSSVGISGWQAVTSSDATYTLSVTTTGDSTEFALEIQP